MKKIALLLTLIFSLSASASHLITGYMYYDHVSSSGNQVTYDVYLDLYGDATGISMPMSTTIYHKELNSSGASTSITANQFGSSVAISGNCGSTYAVNVYTYKTTLTLPKNKAYNFAFSSCCRPGSISNIANPSSQGSYIGMILVTGKADVRPYNNSVHFQPNVNTVFSGTTAAFEICSPDPDADSLGFAIVTPKNGTAASLTPSNITYATGFSNASPLGTGNTVSIDTANRMLVVNSSTQQNAVVNIRIIEYSKDTVGTYKIMSVIYKEMIINVVTPSSGMQNSPISFTGASGGFALDTLLITTSNAVYPYQSNFDSTQLILLDPNGAPSNFIIGSTNLNNSYDSFKLHLSDSLSPGLWTLISSMNLDSLAVSGLCNAMLLDTISFFVAPPSPVILGPTDSIYGNVATYTILNTQYLDSASYFLTNGTVNSYQPNFSSFDITWTPTLGSSGDFTFIGYSNGIGDTATISVTVYGIGIPEQTQAILLYPNPTEQFLHIHGYTATATYEIFAMDGQLLQQGPLNSIINIIDLSKGAYVLSIQSKSTRSSHVFYKK